MSFREKTAWVMGVLLLAAGGFYIWEVVGAGLAVKAIPDPSLKLIIVYIAIVIIGSIISISGLAVSAPEDAEAPADERERIIQDRAGHWSGYILAFAAVTAVLHYWSEANGHLMFHVLVIGLMLSQISDYVFQIVLYRRGV